MAFKFNEDINSFLMEENRNYQKICLVFIFLLFFFSLIDQYVIDRQQERIRNLSNKVAEFSTRLEIQKTPVMDQKEELKELIVGLSNKVNELEKSLAQNQLKGKQKLPRVVEVEKE